MHTHTHIYIYIYILLGTYFYIEGVNTLFRRFLLWPRLLMPVWANGVIVNLILLRDVSVNGMESLVMKMDRKIWKN